MEQSGLVELLHEISAIGPYFEVIPGPAPASWRSLRELVDDPAVLAERVAQLRSVLAERTRRPVDLIDQRACASTAMLAFAARLLAPVLAGVAIRGVVLDPDPDSIAWQPVEGGPIPVAWAAATVTPVESAESAAARIEAGVLARAVLPLVGQVGRAFRTSDQVLLGNASSALNGAATMLVAAGVVTVIDPFEVVAVLVHAGALAGTGEYRPSSESVFVRHNCCLFYRIPGGGTCGDCVLNHH